jgi:hypothetical protein
MAPSFSPEAGVPGRAFKPVKAGLQVKVDKEAVCLSSVAGAAEASVEMAYP